MRRFWTQRVAEPVMALLRQGLTPEGLALSLAFGIAAGLFPVIGATTILGLLFGTVLRLNLPALQLANAQILAGVSADPLGTLERYGMTGLHGILGWIAVVPIVVLVLYRVLLPALHATRRRMRPSEAP
jgi:hypothetical protein